MELSFQSSKNKAFFFYYTIVLFLVFYILSNIYFALNALKGLGNIKSALNIVLFIMLALIVMYIMNLIEFLRLSYKLKENSLEIKSLFLRKEKREIPYKEIEKVEKLEKIFLYGFQITPFSTVTANYWIKGIGKLTAAATDLKNKVLIITKKGKYILTPKDRERFIEELRKRLG